MPLPNHSGAANIFTKYLTLISLVLSILLLTRCQQTASAAALPTSAAYYWLMVINGTGGGHYQAGTTVHIWANPHPKGWTFDVWKGATQSLPDIYSMHATITMPPQDIQIEATYTQIPPWSASFARMFGRDVSYYFPPSSFKGVIAFFHGSGGDAREWTDLGAERRHFFDDAIADGNAVRAILAAFRASGQIPAQVPIYGVGISQGGRFATLASFVLNMKVSAI